MSAKRIFEVLDRPLLAAGSDVKLVKILRRGGILIFITAALAGFASFASPCVLPLIPGYLSFISGISIDALGHNRGRVLAASVLFVAGFSAVFVSMGASASLIGSFLSAYRPLIEKIAGGFVILFGLSLLGAIELPMFKSGISAGDNRLGLVGAVPLGMSFAVAWTPCVGAFLGSVLLLASQAETVGQGAILLAFYAAGLGIPFLLTAAFFSYATGALRWLNRHKKTIATASGALLIGMGLLMLSGQLSRVTSAVQRLWPTF